MYIKKEQNILLSSGESGYYKTLSTYFAVKVYAVIVSIIVFVMVVVIVCQRETIIDLYKSQLLKSINMATAKSEENKKNIKASARKKASSMRYEVYIRISDIPEEMYKAIEVNAKKEFRTNGVEVLSFLTKKKYK